MSNLGRKFLGMAMVMARHPQWVPYYGINFIRRRRAKAYLPTGEQRSVEEGVLLLGIAGRDEVHCAWRDVPPMPEVQQNVLYGAPNASAELYSLCYVLSKLKKPAYVVETGVAYGFTSSAILSALTQNSAGDLYSVELPQLALGAEDAVGAAIARSLRHRWHLLLGPSGLVLPRLLSSLPKVDIFIHDADHTYGSQSAEYRSVWPRLSPGGILVSDDVVNRAFEDFAEQHGVQPVFVGQHKSRPIGVLKKPETAVGRVGAL